MDNSRKTVNCRVGFSPPIPLDCRVGTAHQSRLCHCERSEAISLHHSLFLVRHLSRAKSKDSIFTTTFTFLLLLFLIAAPAQAQYGGGTGDPNDPYLIYTAEQMNEIGLSGNWDDWDKGFKLMADIDLGQFTGTEFNIIGNDSNAFTGVFDGSDHTISNFTYCSTYAYNIGLFGYVDGPNAEIKNLGMVDPNVDAGTGRRVGSLVGWLWCGTVSNCYAEGGSVSGSNYIGGLVGDNYGGTITNCYSTGSVAGDGAVGGLVGRNEYSTIANSYSTGSVSGRDDVGGLVGWNNGGTITNCYSEGAVTGGERVGGLVGANSGTMANCYSTGSVLGESSVGGLVGWNWGTITDCYSESVVSGTTDVGGLVGRNAYYGRITNCYSTGSVEGNTAVGGLVGENDRLILASFWDIQTSGQSSSAGGTGKTTAEMQTATTFISWGCDPVWTIDEGKDYPRLAWENKPGELITIPSGLYGGGSGEPNDPYLIYTAEHLNMIGWILCDLDKHFKLMADIDLSGFTGTSFNIIGPGWTKCFSGVFNGNGHTISNFTYDCNGVNYIGLFGYVDWRGEIKDLGLIDPNVDAETGDYVGSLVGYNLGTITNCYVEGGSVAGANYVGGLAGYNREDTIINCYSTSSVSGDYTVGGLVGYNSEDTIINCYSTGSVSGIDRVGGLVGGYGGEVFASFWDIETSGQTSSDGGTGKTTDEMQTMNTFTDAGWDFVGERINGSEDIWKMTCEGMSYPKLAWWHPVKGDFLCPDGVDFFDYSFFAAQWAEDNCGASNDCDGTDLDLLGSVDIKDLRIFADNWLAGF